MKMSAEYDDNNGHPYQLHLEIPNISDITDAQAIDLAERAFASDVIADAISAQEFTGPFSVVNVQITDLIRYVEIPS